MNRREFFRSRIAAAAAPLADGNNPALKPEKLYENKSLPTDIEIASSGLTQFSGTWTRPLAAHLLRRLTFGFNRQQLDAVAGMSMTAAVDFLLNIDTTPPAPPVNNYGTAQNPDPDVPFGQTWVNASYSTFDPQRMQSLRSWWAGLTLTDNTIREKMVVFWHNHFATESNIYNDSRYGYKHLALLRQYCLGNFKALVKEITIDPAMLRYLNGYANTKTAPDENYGRELQELFTIGKGAGSHYTEDDVKAAARVLTGWRDNRTAIASYFDPTRHDTGNKQFSAFYNNTVITGKAGSAGAQETDELLDMIFSQVEVARHICRKLYRYFVYYVIDADVENNVIIPLADTFVTNNWEIKPVLEQLFKSEHFYDPNNIGCYIKSPMDYSSGILRQYNISIPSSDLATQYQFWTYVWSVGAIQQQALLDPPNVAGWPAFYQEPQYYELWINSDTLPKRNQLSDLLVLTGYQRNSQKIMIDSVAFADQFADSADPNLLIDNTLEILYAIDISANQKAYLKSILLSGQSADHYWSDIWNQYKSNPSDVNNLNMVKTRLQAMLKYLMDLAEYQLA